MYRDRLTETELELADLEKAYKEQKISAGTFAERWNNLNETKKFLERELHRMGL